LHRDAGPSHVPHGSTPPRRRAAALQVDALRLTFYASPVACLALLPFHARFEYASLTAYRLQAESSYVGG
jgi:hypothetical protein